METTTTLSVRLIDHAPMLVTNATLVGVMGLSLGEAGDHTAILAVGEVVVGLAINGGLYLVNDKYRKQALRLLWKMGFYPKGSKPKRLKDAMELIAFLVSDPAQVSQFWWTMPVCKKGTNGFGDRYGALLRHVYSQLAQAKAEGATIRLAGISALHGTMSRVFNEANAEEKLNGNKGVGVMDLYTISGRTASFVKPAMFIRLRSGLCFVFDELIFNADNDHKTRCACSSDDARHVVTVKQDIENLFSRCQRYKPRPNIFAPRKRTA